MRTVDVQISTSLPTFLHLVSSPRTAAREAPPLPFTKISSLYVASTKTTSRYRCRCRIDGRWAMMPLWAKNHLSYPPRLWSSDSAFLAQSSISQLSPIYHQSFISHSSVIHHQSCIRSDLVLPSACALLSDPINATSLYTRPQPNWSSTYVTFLYSCEGLQTLNLMWQRSFLIFPTVF